MFTGRSSVQFPLGDSRKCVVFSARAWGGAVFRLSRSMLSRENNSEFLSLKTWIAKHAAEGWNLEGRGIYVLIGRNQFYVGQADERGTGTGLLTRVIEHSKDPAKDFFEYFLLFQNTTWQATELNFFERAMADFMKVSSGLKTEQVQPHLGYISPSDLDDFLSQLPFMKNVIFMMGIGMLSAEDEYQESLSTNPPKPVEEPKPAIKSKPADDEICDYVPACAAYLRVGLKYLADQKKLTQEDVSFLKSRPVERETQLSRYPVLCSDLSIIDEYRHRDGRPHYYTEKDCLVVVDGVTYYVTVEVFHRHLAAIQAFFTAHNLNKVQVQKLCEASGRKPSRTKAIVRFFLH